ncbi:MAG: TonB-dependent receptor, partial [Vicinamibacteria bacterium]
MGRFLRILSMCCGLAALCVTTSAQEITATVTGTVTDQSGAPLPGATVIARHLGRGITQEVTTSKTGLYTLPFLATGEYEIAISMPGFKTYTAKNIALHVNDRFDLSASLKIEGLETSIEVSAGSQLIQQTPGVQNLMGATQVQELPLNNRNFVQLATLVPGVSSDLGDEVGIGLTSTVSISINGSRRNAVNWLLDGASNVDVGSNITLLSTPTVDSIEEFKIITSSYSAEWPRSGGGVVNVVTKSGSNVFRGSAYEYFRDDSLNSNAYFRKQSSDPLIRDHAPALDYHNFGFTFGGPIMKDKFFFFYSQEWRNISRAPANLSATVPDPNWLTDPTSTNYVAPAQRDPNAVRLLAAWPQPNVPGANRYLSNSPADQDTRQEVVRLDYTLSQKWRLMGRYTNDLSKTVEVGGLFFGTAVPNVATTQTKVPGQVAVLQATTSINAHTVNEFTFQFSSNQIGTTNPDGTKNKRADYGLTVPEIFSSNPGGIIPTVGITGLTSIGSAQLYNIEYKNFTLADNLSAVRG